MAVAKPIIRQIKDNSESLDFFETVSLPSEDEKTRKIIMDFPTVYIHNWKDSGDFEVYVGESNNIFKRTRQHYTHDGTVLGSTDFGKVPKAGRSNQ